MWYAESSSRRARQIFGDAAVAVWVFVCVQVGRSLAHAVDRLGAPGRAIADAGTGLSQALSDAAGRASGVPLVGGPLAAPLRSAGEAAARVTDAGLAEESAVARLALILGLIAGVVLALVVVLWWVSRRVRWVRAATAAARLRDQDRTLLALRAIANRPLIELRRLGPGLGNAVLAGDPAAIAALASLELRTLGLTPEPARNRRPAPAQR